MPTLADAPPRTRSRPGAFALSLVLAAVLTAFLVALSGRARAGSLALVPLGDPVRAGVVAFNLFFALPYVVATVAARLARRADEGGLLAGLHATLALGAMAAWLAAALVTLMRL